MASSRRRGLVTEDPFDALLSTARGIGFIIPEAVESCDDVEMASHFRNLLKLVEIGGKIPDQKSALDTLARNQALYGFLDTRELHRVAEKLRQAQTVLEAFEAKRVSIVQELTREDVKDGIPVEINRQAAFKQLIEAIAQDRYKLHELTAEARICVELNESPLCWKSQLESLRSVSDQLRAAQRSMDSMTQLIHSYAERRGRS